MNAKTKAAFKKKVDLVITSTLSRITDFQLQSQDDDLVDMIEDFRDHISSYEYIKRNDS